MRRRIRKRIRRVGDGIDLVADLNAAIAINATERDGSSASASSRQSVSRKPPSDGRKSSQGKEGP
jgi:hypothetical protein